MSPMLTWICSDTAEMPIKVTADTSAEAAQAFVDDADWPTETRTYWIEVLVSEPGTLDREVDGEYVKVAIAPQEPACDDGDEHDYAGSRAWGHGGGVVSIEQCAACGLQRITDTWAQCRTTGEQGLESIEYRTPDDDDADRWHCDGCERDYNDATPTGVAADGTTYCPTCAA